MTMSGVYVDFIEILLCFFLLLQTGTSVYSEGQMPNFDVPVMNITAVAGTTAVLPCTITGIGDHQVAWVDHRKKLLTVSDKRIIQDPRISIERPYTKDWNLHIRNVRVNDSGEYLCQINTKPVKSMKLLLTIQEPPIILEHAGDQIVKEGATVALWCKVTGEPYPAVKWYRLYTYDQSSSKAVIGDDGEALKIHNISRYCEDVYECVADNDIEPKASQKMKVSVQFAPEVELYTYKMGQSQGKETILDCRITANPHGYIVWKRNGREITTTHKYGITVYEDDRYTKTLSLRIGNLNENDFGKYECFAQNEHGTDNEEMTLYEHIERRYTTPKPTENIFIDPNQFKGKTKPAIYVDPVNEWPQYPTQKWVTTKYIPGNAGASRAGCASVQFPAKANLLHTIGLVTIVLSNLLIR